jgi:type II secretory pathway pseudopilin PulG
MLDLKLGSKKGGRSGGFTLIELLVGISVGVVVIIGLLYAWSIFTRQADYLAKVNRYNQDMRGLIQIITADMRRAVGPAGTSAIEVECVSAQSGCSVSETYHTSGDCIVFDANLGSTSDAASVAPVATGYRVIEGELQMWHSPTANTTSKGKCSLAKTAGDWITVMELEPSGFRNFRLLVTVIGSRCLEMYVETSEVSGRCAAGSTEKVELVLANVTLEADAVIAGTTTRRFELSDNVKIRNDSIFN